MLVCLDLVTTDYIHVSNYDSISEICKYVDEVNYFTCMSKFPMFSKIIR